MCFKEISDLSDGAHIRLFSSVPNAQKTIFSQASLNGPLPGLKTLKLFLSVHQPELFASRRV